MVKHTVIAEYIYGWKGKAYIAIRKQFSTLCRNTAYYQLSGERNKYLHRYPNLLNRDFRADRPNHLCVRTICSGTRERLGFK